MTIDRIPRFHLLFRLKKLSEKSERLDRQVSRLRWRSAAKYGRISRLECKLADSLQKILLGLIWLRIESKNVIVASDCTAAAAFECKRIESLIFDGVQERMCWVHFFCALLKSNVVIFEAMFKNLNDYAKTTILLENQQVILQTQ